MTYEDIRKMSRRSYVNRSEGWTKVILGNDELQIVMYGVNGIEAKKAIAQANYKLKDIKPAVICETVIETRRRLNSLSEEVGRTYVMAEKRYGNFDLYGQSTKDKTDKLAYEITNIMTYGI